jgi:hypothetical protein
LPSKNEVLASSDIVVLISAEPDERSLHMDDVFGCLLVLAVIVGILYLTLYFVLPLSILVIGGIGFAGAAAGTGMAVYNFVRVFRRAHQEVPR